MRSAANACPAATAGAATATAATGIETDSAMEVVLRQDVEVRSGLRGEVVNVARAGMRALLPAPAWAGGRRRRRGACARRSSPSATRSARGSEAKTVDEARAIAARIEGKELRFDVNAGPTGSLFGSVTATDVADRLWSEQKIRVDRRKLKLDTIKRIGRYTVPLELFTDVTVELKIVVAPEGQELPPEEELAAVAAAQAEAAAAAAAEARGGAGGREAGGRGGGRRGSGERDRRGGGRPKRPRRRPGVTPGDADRRARCQS